MYEVDYKGGGKLRDMTKRYALRAARDELTHPALIVAANETASSFNYENDQPSAASIANGGVISLRAEIDQKAESA
jgi:hypothetical protein